MEEVIFDLPSDEGDSDEKGDDPTAHRFSRMDQSFRGSNLIGIGPDSWEKSFIVEGEHL